MPDAIITSTASTFGTITGTFAADQSTITGTVTGIVTGTLDGSVGVPGPAGPAGVGVPAGGTAGQFLTKIDGTNYNTDWTTVNLSAYAPLASPAFTGNPTAPTAALGDNDTSLATTAFVQQELLSGTANAKNLEVYVRNQTGSTLAAGTIVYINGATGNRPTVTPAQANNDANSAQTMGFVKTSIANNGFGFVIVSGECEALDTSAVAEGTQLYLSPTTAGAYTTTKPVAPNHLVYVGIVIRSHPTQGVILVAVQNGYEISELHDVKITTPTNGQVLKYDSTQSLWVNGTDVGGVAWGGITGTLSSQTDLQTALDGKYSTTNPAGYITSSALTPYLTSATAASTYQTLSGMSSYLTTSTAASTYATKASPTFTGLSTFNNPGNYAITLDNSVGNYTSISSGVYSIYASTVEVIRLSAGGIKYPDGLTQGVAYPGSSGFLLKADNLSGLADTSTARTNLGLGTMAVETASNYLTTSTAASTYFTIASAANKADLASPALTGTPTAPTAAAATNTTQIATTAFVQQEVPAASTTAAGKVELATNAEVITGTSTTLAVVPGHAGFLKADPRLRSLAHVNYTTVSGSGAISSNSGLQYSRELYLNSLAVGRSNFHYGVVGAAGAATFLTSKADKRVIDFSKKVWVAGTACCAMTLGSINYSGDSNTACRICLGGYGTLSSGNMSQKGIGWKKVGGTSSAVVLSVHNGTILTDVTTSFVPVSEQSFDWIIYSDGAGNVTLYINGSQVATTSSGPTGTTSNGNNAYIEQVEASTTPSVRQIMHCNGGWIYFAD